MTRRVDRLQVVALAIISYVPLLFARPGRMVGDTKLYLYLDPGRLMSTATRSWDPAQYGGWVPHQMIAYLWPQGPWYWVFDRLGIPDWIAHRLWLGTLLLLAALGVRFAARRLGLGASAATCAAVVYQLSPYVLPYVSRTSAMLLPWAALGWIIGLTIDTARGSARWRSAAALALVIASCSAVNATAIVMLVPGPVLWLADAVGRREITLRRAVATCGRIGVLAIGVCAWWIVMVRTQSRYGADVLRFSESVEATSFTTASTEVLRGMGYWLFYVRDPYSFATSAAADYMGSGTLLAVGFALLTVCLAGLVVVRWNERRYAALLVLVGTVIAVGPHPISDPSPLMSAVAENSRGIVPLALRSSARAVPLVVLGLALGAGALVHAVQGHVHRGRRAVAMLVVGLAVLNMPVLFDGSIIDPSLSRDQDVPAAWTAAAGAVGNRVMQLPGAEFGAFRWGYTAEPPLVGLASAPVLTRDLLPLGSAGLEDLFLALDDRAQSGTLEPESVAAVARLLGVDTVWLPNDLAFDRYRNPWPAESAALLADAPGLSLIDDYGEITINVPDVEMIDERVLGSWGPTGTASPDSIPLAAVTLLRVDDAVAAARTASGSVVVLVGSGDGVVDAAAAGLLDGHEILVYAADGTPVGVGRVILTDSNRDRAHHWRSSQDVVGATEAGGAATELWDVDEADARLPIFGDPDAQTADEQTVARLDGATTSASGYGEYFAYRPERRPAMAVDRDPRTAWTVGDRGDPVGQSLSVDGALGGSLTLLQPQDRRANRMITGVRVTTDTASVDVVLDERSLVAPGQRVAISGSRATIEITAIGPRPGGFDSGPSGVGFAELGVGPFDEYVTVPRLPDLVDSSTPLSVVLSRLRVDPRSRWRSDPEPRLLRSFVLDSDRSFDTVVTLRLAANAADGVLDRLLGAGAATATARLAGDPSAGGRSVTDGDAATAWVTPFDGAVGAALDVRLASALDSFSLVQPTDDRHSRITAVRLTWEGGTQTVAVPPGDAGGRSTIDLPQPVTADTVRLEIDAIEARTTVDRRYGEQAVLPAAVVELESDSLAAPLAPTSPTGCRADLVQLDGEPLPVDLPADVWSRLGRGERVEVRPCAAVDLAAGSHRLASSSGLDTGIDIDRITMVSGPDVPTPTVRAAALTGSATHRRATVEACPAGCWFTTGEGFNPAWEASIDGRSIGAPRQINGGAGGWWLPPSTSQRIIDLRWGPQGAVTAGLLVSLFAGLVCAAILLRRRGAIESLASGAPMLERPWRGTVTGRRATAIAVGMVAVTALVAAPTTALWSLPIAAVIVRTRRVRAMGLVAPSLAALIGAYIVARQVTQRMVPNQVWVLAWDRVHRPGLLLVVILALSTLVDSPDRDPQRTGTAPTPPAG